MKKPIAFFVHHQGRGHANRTMAIAAGTALVALNDPGLIARAKAELTSRTEATPYVCPIPDDVHPPLDMASNAGR